MLLMVSVAVSMWFPKAVWHDNN